MHGDTGQLAHALLGVGHERTAGCDQAVAFEYQIVADILGVELQVEEVPVGSHLAEHPGAAPFLCHRIYDLSRIGRTGLSLPSTTVEEGLRLHVEGWLARRD